MFPPWGWMKRPFGHISRVRKRKIDDWINCLLFISIPHPPEQNSLGISDD
jgi:hypothetical protein